MNFAIGFVLRFGLSVLSCSAVLTISVLAMFIKLQNTVIIIYGYAADEGPSSLLGPKDQNSKKECASVAPLHKNNMPKYGARMT